MSATITVLDSSYDWKVCTLVDFLNEGNYPVGWDEFFFSLKVKTELEKISSYLGCVATDRAKKLVDPTLVASLSRRVDARRAIPAKKGQRPKADPVDSAPRSASYAT